ncbi:P-loop containing nucleoside triphosphate hydrolase protein [Wallemia mellicola]|uniref:P-loop containing nucleoside triphosphate hydrolase protein n=1 Tax=Wallemia mellicola TaxID=1708541 RepID=A0A4T0TD92_9BASI|nr:P-loop containing nucleoside triphosphate hydrolase protein [Wallemia mellicola]
MDSANSVNIAIEEDKKDKSSVSFFALWKYSNGLEKFINLVALVAAIGAGTGLPLMTIVLRDFTDSFVEFGSAIQSSQANIDEITQKFKTDTNSTAIYFIYIAVGVAVLTYIFLSAFVITGETVAGTVRKEYFKSILHQDISYFDNIGAGEIVDRIQAQTLLLQDGISQKVPLVIMSCSTFIAAFVIGFILEWRLTLVTAAIFPVIMIVGTASEMFSSKYQSRALEGQSKASSIAEEALSSIRNAHSLNYQKQLNQLFGKHASEVKKNNLLNAVVWVLTVGLYIITNAFTNESCIALAFWFGITLTIWGYTQAGTVIAVFFCVVIGSFALTMAPTHMQAFALAQNAAANIYPTIEDDNAISARADEGLRPSTDTLLGHIAFDDVDFIYPSRPSVTVLKGFSVDILPGKSIALVGSSGSGKSTVVSILERFYKPKSGSVTLDGKSIDDYSLKWLRSQIGYVGQEPVLFSCSIKENVEYGLIGTEFENKSADVKFQLVQEACKKANAHDFVCELPEGYETDVSLKPDLYVGNRGFLLSGGQKQRIAIARAIVSNPKILILDEATSALDTLSENVVQKALDNASTGRTTISIAHRLSTIKNADSILVMKQGTIVEQGTHDDLIQIQDGIYAGLVAMQNLDQDSSKPQMILPSQVLSKEDEKGSVSSDMKELVRKDGNEIILDTTDKKYGLFRIIMRLGKLNQNDWLIYIIAFIACAGSGMCYPVLSIIFGSAIEVFQADNDSDLRNDGNRQALFFTAIAIVSFFTFGISNWGCMHTAANLSYKLRMASFENLLLKDVSYFDKSENSIGKILNYVSDGPQKINNFAGMTLATILSNLVTLVGGMIIALCYGWKLALVCIACIPLLLCAGFAQLYFVVQREERNKKSYSKSSSLAAEAATAIRTVASLTCEDFLSKKYDDTVDGVIKSSSRNALISHIFYAISQGLQFLVMALAFWYGSRLLANLEYTTRNFFIVLISVIFASIEVGMVISYCSDLTKSKSAAEAALNIIDYEPLIDTNATAKSEANNITGHIRFENVFFKYPTRPEVQVLSGVDLDVKPGQIAALVGASGCGKSSTIQLLERFYDVQFGKITIDGTDIREFNVKDYRKNIALVSQEPTLYSGSIHYNVAIGSQSENVNDVLERQGISLHDVIEACKAANIHDFIECLPDGYKTDVGGRGLSLSGGQKQRIAIARAFMRNPKILLLDEATSALDSESEKVVQNALEIASRGRTTVTVAHRLASIKNADVIYVYHNGGIAEKGTHSELISKRGFYYAMFKEQQLSS